MKHFMKWICIYFFLISFPLSAESIEYTSQNILKKENYRVMKDIYENLPPAKLPMKYPGEITAMKRISGTQLSKERLFSLQDTKNHFEYDILDYWEKFEEISACRLPLSPNKKAIILRTYYRRFPDEKHRREFFYLCLLNDDYRIIDSMQIYDNSIHVGKSKPPMREEQDFLIAKDDSCIATTHYYYLDTGKETFKTCDIYKLKEKEIFKEEKYISIQTK